MSSSVYRKASLERLSSPEQLDQMLRVVNPMGWLALLALLALIVGAVAWGFYGSLPEKVQGLGILIRQGGMQQVSVGLGGRITELKISPGELVSEGQVLALVSQPDLEERIRSNEGRLGDLRARRTRVEEFGEEGQRLEKDQQKKQRELLEKAMETAKEGLRLEKDQLKKQRELLAKTIETEKGRIKWLAERIASEEKLLAEGLITKSKLITTKQQLDAVQAEIRNAEKGIEDLGLKELQLTKKRQAELGNAEKGIEGLGLKELQWKKGRQDELASISSQIKETERAVAMLEEKIAKESRVLSPCTGHVIEVLASRGDLLRSGGVIANIELTGREAMGLQVIAYVSALEGANVQIDMDLHISPQAIKPEEYGVMLGRVREVGKFPATKVGMLQILGSQELVSTLSATGPVIQIQADPVSDPDTTSGYGWSSAGGPPTIIQSGSMCSVSVITRRRKPVSLVIPYMKKTLLGL